MEQKEIESKIKYALYNLGFKLTKEEEDYIIHSTICNAKRYIKRGMDTFLLASIFTNSYLNCFKNDSKNMKKDEITGKVVDVSRIKQGIYGRDVIFSAIWLGLSIIESPIESRQVNAGTRITKIRETANFEFYFDRESTRFSDFYTAFQHTAYNMPKNVLAFYGLYQKVYNDAISYEYQALRRQCKSDAEFEEKYGRYSKFYKERNKIKIKGGLDNE